MRPHYHGKAWAWTDHLAITCDRTEALGLSLMERRNESRHQTAFTVSIEAREGVTTGISAADRAQTIRTAINCKKRISPHRVIFSRLWRGTAAI